MDLPEPTGPVVARADVFLEYLAYFRQRVAEKVAPLSDSAVTTSLLPSGWTLLELVKHLTYVEMRWLEWGFEGAPVGDPWGDRDGERWRVTPSDTRQHLIAELAARGRRSEEIVRRHSLDEHGRPGPRWSGAEPPTLERVLFHLLQEYARHVGHVDIVTELIGGPAGE